MARRLLGFSSILIWFLLAPAMTRAASISGILLYAADGFGTPNGHATYDACSNIEAQLWRTMIAGKWHGLAVYAGLPPESLSGYPLNARNFFVEIPLHEGENAFTLLGEPGPLTPTDDYERFAINLYFNGNTETVPGLSVLFDRYASPLGSPVAPNRSHCIYTLSLNEVQGKPDAVYDDGVDRVTVTGASFLSMDRFDPEWRFDLLGPQTFGPSGARDWIGVLRVYVEPSVSAVDVGAAPRAIAPAPPGRHVAAGSGSQPMVPPAGVPPAALPPGELGYGHPGAAHPGTWNAPNVPPAASKRTHSVPPTTDRLAEAETEATPADTPAFAGTPEGTPDRTASPLATPATPVRSPQAKGTKSPGLSGSPSPRVSPSPARPSPYNNAGVVTPTPAKTSARTASVATLTPARTPR